MVSILSSNADKPMPAFRSNTYRFGTHIERFNGADPIHLESPGSHERRRPSQRASPGSPASPFEFRRGTARAMSQLGGDGQRVPSSRP